MDLSALGVSAADDEGVPGALLDELGELSGIVGEVGVHGGDEVWFGILSQGCFYAVDNCSSEAEFPAAFYEGDVVMSPVELLDGLYGSVGAAVVDDYDLEVVGFPVFLEGFD